MGQKINPIGMRLKINRTWDSVWFAKKENYGTYLIQDFKIRKYINDTIKNSGISKILIERPTKKCNVTIFTSRPGFVIGKKGSDIEKLKPILPKLQQTRFL
jgi:Ribosomal protein S3